MLIAINISSLFLTLKYVKCCLGQNLKNTFQSDLRFSNMSQLFRSKTTIPILNQEHNIISYLNTVRIDGLNKGGELFIKDFRKD